MKVWPILLLLGAVLLLAALYWWPKPGLEHRPPAPKSFDSFPERDPGEASADAGRPGPPGLPDHSEELGPFSTVGGCVQLSDDGLAEGAVVELHLGWGLCLRVVSGKDGRFQFDAPRRFDKGLVRVTRAGYATSITPTTVPGSLEVTLEPGCLVRILMVLAEDDDWIGEGRVQADWQPLTVLDTPAWSGMIGQLVPDACRSCEAGPVPLPGG